MHTINHKASFYAISANKCRRRVLATLLSLLILPNPGVYAAGNDLPDLGDPASQILSPAQEKILGKQFYQQAQAHPTFIDDAQLNHYIQSLGDRLVSNNNLANEQFTFFLFNNGAVNAFAVPGGYIGFYSGLIGAAENESQLASVVAHEIAHVTQRHLARFYAKQQGISLASTAAIVAGIIAASQGAVQAGSAAVYSGIAAQQQAQINFTRGHEEEADRVGIQLLANSNFDTNSMSEMFDVLRRASLRGENERFEFLRTHPLSSRRIAEARARAAKQDNSGSIINSLEFVLFKARLHVLTASNRSQLQQEYEFRYQENETPQGAYALALIHQLAAQPKQATPYINQLVSLAPESVDVLLLQAENLLDRGESSESLNAYAELNNNYPFHYPILNAYTKAMSRLKQHQKAESVLQDYLVNAENANVNAYREIAFHQESLNDMPNSRINLADYFIKTDEPDSAHGQLNLALKETGLSEQDKQRINAKLEQVKQLRRGQKN